MASSVETIYWPIAIGFAFAFIIASFVILSETNRDVAFHTSEEIGQITAESYIWSYLNQIKDGSDAKATNYWRISENYCGGSLTVKDQEISQPDILNWIKMDAVKPGICGGGTETILEKGGKGKDKRFTYDIKVPVRGGEVMTLRTRYEIDAQK